MVIASGAFASTRTVDGVGGAAGVFANVSDALLDLGGSADATDGAKDTINITANIVEPNGFTVNFSLAAIDNGSGISYPPLGDELEINGGGNVISFVAGTSTHGTAIGDAVRVMTGADMVFTYTNLTMIPDTSVDPLLTDDSFVIIDQGSIADTNVTINIIDVDITANDGTGNPLDPWTAPSCYGLNKQALPAGAIQWMVESGNGGISCYSTDAGLDTGWVVNIDQCGLAFMQRSALLFYADEPTAQWNITNSSFRAATNGIGFSGAAGTWLIDNCVFSDNDEVGINLASQNDPAATFDIDNCIIANNNLEGIRIADSDLGLENDLSNNIIVNNGSFGIDIYGLDVDRAGAANTISDCLIAGNGGQVVSMVTDIFGVGSLDNAGTSANIRTEPTGVAGFPIQFVGCTIHDYLLDGSATDEAVVAIAWDGATDLEIELIDCIITGSATDVVGKIGETGGGEAAPTGASITAINSAVVTAGAYAIAGLGEATDGGGLVSDDPAYAGVAIPVDADSFLVTSADYVGAASAGADLVGWAGDAGLPLTVTVAASGGDFTVLQTAIDSFTVGGSNENATAPFTIAIDPAYEIDESLSLNDSNTTYAGPLAGDLIIRSATPGTPATIKLQAGLDAADDGLKIYQYVNITFQDLLFCPSTTGVMFNDDMITIDETAANTDENTISFINCVLTDIDADGPIVTSKADFLALDYPVAMDYATSSAMSIGSVLIKLWDDAGELVHVNVEDCVLFAQMTHNLYLRPEGVPEEVVTVKDCLIANGADWLAGIVVRGVGETYNILGTAAPRDGDLTECTAILSTGWHPIWAAGPTGSTTKIENVLVDVDDIYGTADARPFSGGSTVFDVDDSIFNITTDGGFIVDYLSGDSTIDNTTLNIQNDAGVAWLLGPSSATSGSLTVTNSIISGALLGPTGSAAVDGGINFVNCGVVKNGPDAIASDLGVNVTETDCIDADPEYVSRDATSGSFMDVNATAYATAASGGAPLGGGANFVGTTAVHDWIAY